MKLTLPISQLITKENISEFNNLADAYVLNGHNEVFIRSDKELIHHISTPILDIYNPEVTFYNRIARNNYCSCHLGMACLVPEREDYHYVSDKIMDRGEIKQKIKDKIEQLRKQGIKNIALENCNYYPYSAYQYICEPDFIKEVIEDNDIGFCLDIAHAIVSAWNMSDSFYNYVKRLPLDRITEIHMSGHGMVGDQARDLHEAPGKNQFEILDKINNTWKDLKDVYVIVEYYRCFKTLLNQYITLKTLCK